MVPNKKLRAMSTEMSYFLIFLQPFDDAYLRVSKNLKLFTACVLVFEKKLFGAETTTGSQKTPRD